MHALINRFTSLYPFWLIGTAVMAFLWPQTMAWFSGQWIIWALTTVMLGMGLTLTATDFQNLLKMPGSLMLGFLAQYTIMPLLGWGISHALSLETGAAIGLILVAACPGGTASNVITYLAGANVALSVVITLVSTMLAFIMTPLWCEMLIGTYVPVDALGLCLTTLQAVVIPVIVGVFLNWKFPKTVARISWTGPVLSVIAICGITGGIVAQSADSMVAYAGKLSIAVLVLHLLGFILGYVVSKVFGYSDVIARTVSIEVGMQNGGMAAMLAKKHFAVHPLAAVPAVFSALMQNVLGALLAAYWRARPLPPDAELEDLTEVAPEKIQP
ncbi:BASS family bile acid:Na+ symporter [Prosthecobacter fusiformis]|uniref:BASS family bile acid:Na+ symporter n=1 Tax=Prosthecobacter fusiformis TaxID=48464 RepID=A0A4R7RP81_9BACT|nr:bile acid:sodium symporter family protein [Prosthecobacter fusiformis]TDU66628.1 BASS family bile acid:Na+ symporter [Prosthecobacter fusiformis]